MGRRKTENKVDFKADYILKLEKREEEKAKKEAGQGENIPDNLITWVFQDDFIPRGKITKDGNYSCLLYTSVNFVIARQMLEKREACILKAKAPKIKPVITKLQELGIDFNVNPSFNY